MNFRGHISEIGKVVDKRRLANRVQISSRGDLTTYVKEKSGLYWIETDMPLAKIELKANKRRRKSKPPGVGFTTIANNSQIIYAGTEKNIQSRLLEHLFNEGSSSVTKMSIDIRKPSFSKCKWFISCVYIKDDPTRYALESWWRLNIGWPPFCIR